MYACGIPVGLLVDAKGPRPGVLLGSALLGTGYFGLYRGGPAGVICWCITHLLIAYDAGAGSVALPWLCFFACLTGVGGASAFSGSIKTC